MKKHTVIPLMLILSDFWEKPKNISHQMDLDYLIKNPNICKKKVSYTFNYVIIFMIILFKILPIIIRCSMFKNHYKFLEYVLKI